jgi:hypothetical protein
MATYYVAEGGSAANKGAATSGTYPGGCMSPSVHNGETFSAGDEVHFSDEGGVIRAQIIPPSSGSDGSPIIYKNKSGDTPEISGADVCSFSQSGGGSPDIIEEGFEGAGYEFAWDTVQALASGTLDEDADVADVGSPAGWGSQCLKAVITGSGDTARIYETGLNGGSGYAISYGRVGFCVTSESLANGDNQYIAKVETSGSAMLWELGLDQTAGTFRAYIDIRHDGSSNITYFDCAVDDVLDIEVKWDSTNDVYEWKKGGVSQANGALTGSAAGWTLERIFIGMGSTPDAAATVYYDNIGLDSSDWIGGSGNWYSDDLSADPDQVYSDDTRLTEEAVLGNLGAGEWHWEAGENRLWVGTDPSGAVIEGSVRDHCISVVAKSYLTFDGLNVEKALFDNIEFKTSGGYHTVQNCGIYRAFWRGLVTDSGSTSYNTVDSCTVHYNGDSGIQASGGSSTGWLIKRNDVRYNGWNDDRNVYTAGINATSSNGHTIEHNYVIDNWRSGIWLDVNVTNVTIQYNFCKDNTGWANAVGIHVEAGCSNNKVLYNVVRGSINSQIKVTENSGGNGCNNNLIYGNTCYADGKQYGLVCLGPDEANTYSNNIIKNNIVTGTFSQNLVRIGPGGAINDGTYGSGNVYENNCFGPEAANFLRWNVTSYSTYDAWLAASSQTDNNVEADPAHTNIGADDFTLGGASPCINTGVDLGATYDDALDPSTSWPSGVVTADQDSHGAGWEVGAYVYANPVITVQAPASASTVDNLTMAFDAGTVSIDAATSTSTADNLTMSASSGAATDGVSSVCTKTILLLSK